MDGRYRRGHAAAAAEKFTRKTFERALLPPLRSRTLVSIPCLSEKSQSGKHHQLKPKRPVDSTSSTDGSPRATIANLFKLFLFVQLPYETGMFQMSDIRRDASGAIPRQCTSHSAQSFSDVHGDSVGHGLGTPSDLRSGISNLQYLHTVRGRTTAVCGDLDVDL